jgi:hypothetical protein
MQAIFEMQKIIETTPDDVESVLKRLKVVEQALQMIIEKVRVMLN